MHDQMSSEHLGDVYMFNLNYDHLILSQIVPLWTCNMLTSQDSRLTIGEPDYMYIKPVHKKTFLEIRKNYSNNT